MSLEASELILNQDGSVYHLNLRPENIATTIILVGDQDRVDKVTKHFDSIEFTTQKREFKTTTGTFKNKRITVISTGIGPDNIDIVLNELDALANIDLSTRKIKEKFTQLSFIRIGTSGSLQANIPVNSFVLSTHGLDLNGLLHSYQIDSIAHPEIENAFVKHTNWSAKKSYPIFVSNSISLAKRLSSSIVFQGITATAGGFYGPQGRVLRLALEDPNLNNKIDSFSFEGKKITNLEMETAAIYGLSQLLGHQAVSLNAIIANRANGTFSENPTKIVADLIVYTLEKLTA
ncbi:MAG: nucleoside phosphorylase [Flavobacteriia bacterium]|nr:nucleoside phosphorylase [Flavobacteriia bacterium]OIP45080.1 MAG: phosphorylase [Flavobacteriaceae bacterium CG2_30_31_66]PIV95274.1 MAG: phosphorylase [Flavobacteriaceae bacterium CG17_big_fil_post_rev_8_21_14_2_50_31_13]PIX11404.1 MAG: phosphorylase [Flavobacteriaceae bacterium CG_4_8_14_3_um_filter_31_8]PIY13605.1 MAG: phosphorylase [Flavobacteriaceae bacterium CG_4_10_14_3_um_filter_31_253]PIZ11834.1 MAG: phosphorylase [Flavobacteriaceae bacterium CG_4_10_14_0_8_um_filter_31_99]PJC089